MMCKRQPIRRDTTTRRRGSTLIELSIVVALFAVVLLSSLALIESGSRFSSATLEITALEDVSQQVLFKIEKELANASGMEPRTTLSTALPAGQQGTLALTSTLGMPPHGILLVDPGQANEERISYGSLNADLISVGTLTRGEQCTSAVDHAVGATALWVGLARPIDVQVAPPATSFDGIVQEGTQTVFYRGDGSGFSYRRPIDPTGGNDFIDANGDIQWGAQVRGIGHTLDGRAALYYQPQDTFEEASTGNDINRDGDTDDIFDIGQIRRIHWDVTNPFLATDDVAIGPSAILQEQCDWGADLDNDGFDDPIFLWDQVTSQLHTRLFVLGRGAADMPVVRKVESVSFLRNTPEI